jgi:hypothetical protein
MEVHIPITGATILLIAEMTKDSLVAGAIYKEARLLALRDGASKVFGKHVREVALRLTPAG